jgi:protein TonB
MPLMMHWHDHGQPQWRGLMAAATLAIALHLILLWGMAGSATSPHTQTARQISMTLLSLAANSPGKARPAPAPEPVVKPKSEPAVEPAPRPEPVATPEPVAEMDSEPAPEATPQASAQPEVQAEPETTITHEPASDTTEAVATDSAGGQAAAGQAVPDSEPDHSAAFLNNPPPHYPNAARRRGYEGVVMLNVEVLANGRCGRIELLRSSGHEILDHEALATVKTWRFVPAKLAGIAVDRWYQVPVRFRLRNR